MISKTTIKNIFSSKKHQRFGVEEKSSKSAKESFKHKKFDNCEIGEESSIKLEKKEKLSLSRKYQEL